MVVAFRVVLMVDIVLRDETGAVFPADRVQWTCKHNDFVERSVQPLPSLDFMQFTIMPPAGQICKDKRCLHAWKEHSPLNNYCRHVRFRIGFLKFYCKCGHFEG